MDGIDWLLLGSRWAHVSAAIVAIGGAAFTRWALMPAARAALSDEQHQQLREASRARWSRIVYVCIALLLVTGAINFLILALPPKIEPMPYHAIFGVKFLAALGVFFLASALVGRAPGLEALRHARAKWLSVILVLAAVIVLLSGVLSQVRQQQVGRSRAAQTTPTVTYSQ